MLADVFGLTIWVICLTLLLLVAGESFVYHIDYKCLDEVGSRGREVCVYASHLHWFCKDVSEVHAAASTMCT